MEVVLASCGGEPIPAQPPAQVAGDTPTAAPQSLPPSPSTRGAAQAEAQRLTPEPTAGEAYLSVARGVDPAAITTAALAAIGGIERFVKGGDDVVSPK